MPPSMALIVADEPIWRTVPNASNCLAGSTGQGNTACNLSAGVSKSKVFRGR
jgi:hypothetical protein